MTSVERVYNFSSGPAMLPVPVLEEIQRDMMALHGVGNLVAPLDFVLDRMPAVPHEGAHVGEERFQLRGVSDHGGTVVADGLGGEPEFRILKHRCASSPAVCDNRSR